MVAEKLQRHAQETSRPDGIHLFARCPVCGAMLYTPDLDLLTGHLEFFQLMASLDFGSMLQVQRIEYDVGNWKALAEGGDESPATTLVTWAGRSTKAMPGEDLLCGVCAPPGTLLFKDVKDAIDAVNIAYP